MSESFIAVFLFWCAFGFSVGPFWISTMQAAIDMPFKTLCYHYTIYQFFGWLPLVLLIGFIVSTLGGINSNLFIALHLIGMVVILYLSFKIFQSKIKKVASFEFKFKQMILLSWTNPKVWVMLPIGAVAAKFGDSIWVNTTLFYLTGIPIYIFGFLFWVSLGKLGSKISLNKLSYFNAFLLALFALYIGFEGLMMIIE